MIKRIKQDYDNSALQNLALIIEHQAAVQSPPETLHHELVFQFRYLHASKMSASYIFKKTLTQN